MENNTKVATLEGFRTKKYNKWLGVGVGLVLSMLLLIAGSAAYFSGVFVEASNGAPVELIISNVTDSTARIDWTTKQENQGYIEYGTNSSALSLIAPESTAGTSHTVDLSLLKPATTYYFRIHIGEKVYDDAGSPWTLVTKNLVDGSTDSVPAPPDDQTLVPTLIPTSPTSSCPSRDCQTIRSLLGATCSTADYIRAGCSQ